MSWLSMIQTRIAAGSPPHSDPAFRDAIGRLGAMLLISLLAIIGVGLVAMMLIRRHRRRIAGSHPSKKKRRPPPDPWFESARRVPDPEGGPKSRIIQLPGREPTRPAAADDDTVDIDPEELDQHDVDGDDEDPPTPSRGG